MKAHKFRGKLTTAKEVWAEFNAQLLPRIDKAIFDRIGTNQGIITYSEFKQSSEGVKLVATIRTELIKEWENKGRNMAFLKSDPMFDFMNRLHQKHFGKQLD